MKSAENKNDLNSLIAILDGETKSLVSRNFIIYENFKREYTIFIKLLYDKLRNGEHRCLEYLYTSLGQSVLAFGTDEFTCDYREWSETLASIEEALGGSYSPNKYANPLVTFKNMYNDFFYLLGGNANSKESQEQFAELTKRCLTKIGFDQVKTTYFMGSIVFEIDNCSRIVKGMDALFEEQRKYKEEHPGTFFITDEDTIRSFVGNYLENWFSNKSDKLGDDAVLRPKVKSNNLIDKF